MISIIRMSYTQIKDVDTSNERINKRLTNIDRHCSIYTNPHLYPDKTHLSKTSTTSANLTRYRHLPTSYNPHHTAQLRHDLRTQPPFSEIRIHLSRRGNFPPYTALFCKNTMWSFHPFHPILHVLRTRDELWGMFNLR